MNLFRYGPGKRMVKAAVWISWPIIIAGKTLSNMPVLKWIINPFFRRPWNEVTSVPIGVSLDSPDSVPLPRMVVERLIEDVDERFVLNECICRNHNNVKDRTRRIGCFALGPATKRMHPSHGRYLSVDEAKAHLRLAAEAGLIANIAHVWIDPLAFWTRFRDLMFICLCDDTSCLYRTHMKSRGPNLDGACKKLPGIHIDVNEDTCDGCGTCADKCFVKAITITDNVAIIGADCKGCGRCADVCPEKAVRVSIDGEEELYRQLKERIRESSELPLKSESGREVR